MTDMTTRRSVLRLAAASSLASALAPPARAQSADIAKSIQWAQANLPNSTPDIVAAAAAEGRLSLLLLQIGDDESVAAMVKAFRGHYPFIDVAYTMQSTTQIMNKFNAEVNAKRGINDYVHLPSNLKETNNYIASGAVATFVVSQDAAFPEPSRRSGIWYPWLRQHGVTAWRADALSDAEKKLVRTYQGLGDPRFKGRLGLNGVNNSVVQTGAYTLLNADPALWAGLVANQPRVKASSAAVIDGLLAGEYDVALLSGFSTAATAAKEGAPVEFGITAPSATQYVPGAISALAPHPNAAKLWQDWVMSHEGQALWSTQVGSISARPDVTGAWSLRQPWFFDDESGDRPIDWADFTARQPAIVARFRKDFQAG